MKLYGSLTSPYVRKLRILVLEKHLKVDFLVEGPADAAGNVARLNPLGKVPVFERDDGEVYFDSPMIAEYLDSLAAPALIPAAGEERWQVQRWHALGQGVLDAVVARLMESRREAPVAAVMTKQEGKVQAALAFAAARAPASGFLVGQRLTLADIALAVALDYVDLRYAHDWRGKHPTLARWHAAMSARPSFAETLPPKG